MNPAIRVSHSCCQWSAAMKQPQLEIKKHMHILPEARLPNLSAINPEINPPIVAPSPSAIIVTPAILLT